MLNCVRDLPSRHIFPEFEWNHVRIMEQHMVHVTKPIAGVWERAVAPIVAAAQPITHDSACSDF